MTLSTEPKPRMSMVSALGAFTVSAVEAARVRLDAWQNSVTGFGTTRDKTTYGSIVREAPLSDEQLSALYHYDDMAARIVDVVPDEMMREGFTTETGGDDLDTAIKEKLDSLSAAEKIADGIRWARAYGGAALLLGCDDGRPVDMPLVPERAQDLTYLYVIDRRLLWPIRYYDAPGHPRLGEPSHYMVTTVGGHASSMAVVHESRLVIFRGSKTGARERLMLASWDLSVLQRPHDVLRSFNVGWKSVETLLTDGHQAVFKIAGLAEIIAGGGLEPMQKRLQVIEMYRSVMRALVVDAGTGGPDGEPAESYERQTTSFADIPATLDRIVLRFCAAAQMPATIVMGQSPAGMNATGESDFRWFYDRLRAKQTTEVAPRIRRVVGVWLRTEGGRKATKGKPPKQIGIKFPPLWTETPLNEATRRKTIAEADAAYINAQVLQPDEVALARFRPEGFATEIMLTDEGTKARSAALSADLASLAGSGSNSAPATLTLTASDIATITKVNEARRSVGLEPLPPGDGELTMPAFKAKYSAAIAEAAAAEAGGAAAAPTGHFDATTAKVFELHRDEDETGVSGTGVIADGVEFADGSAVLKWKTATSSTTIFRSVEDMLKVHGHGGKTRLVYLPTTRTDGGDDQPRDDDGRFGEGGGGSSGKATTTAPPAAIHDAKIVGGAEMNSAVAKAAEGPRGGYLTVYSPEDYAGMKCFTAHDGKVGGALKDHGDGRVEAVSLFNAGGPKDAGVAMLDHLVAHGANCIECFDGGLVKLYEGKGFKESSRVGWDDQYAPKGWNPAKQGRPALVSMKLTKK